METMVVDIDEDGVSVTWTPSPRGSAGAPPARGGLLSRPSPGGGWRGSPEPAAERAPPRYQPGARTAAGRPAGEARVGGRTQPG